MRRKSVFSMKGGGIEYIGIVHAGEVKHVHQLMERELKLGKKTPRVLICLISGGIEFVKFKILERYVTRREAANHVNNIDWAAMDNDMINTWPSWTVEAEFRRLMQAPIRSVAVDEWMKNHERTTTRQVLSVEMD